MQPSAFKTVALRLSRNLFWRSKLIPCARKQGVIMREKMQEPRHFPHVNPCLSFFFLPPKPLCCSNILFQYTCLPSSLPQHHWLYVLVAPLCHYVSTLRTRAPLSYKFLPSWTESGFSDCCVPSGYFRSHYVNGGNWNVDSVSQREAMAKDTTAKPALLLSAYFARATLPNPLFAFNSVCRSCQAQVWWCLNAVLKFHPSNKNGGTGGNVVPGLASLHPQPNSKGVLMLKERNL